MRASERCCEVRLTGAGSDGKPRNASLMSAFGHYEVSVEGSITRYISDRGRPVLRQDFFNPAGNNRDPGIVPTTGHMSLARPGKREDPSMTIRTRIALGISAATLAFSLALAPPAFAQDSMKLDLDFKSGVSNDNGTRRDTVSKETRSRDAAKKDDRAKRD